ncbi:MAG TPA: dienelactone hydrolase family protein [Caldimonas sp.]|jgi:carboxymethylenebutenolidase|nr:dienelactone hydrolase family protein [Caldimonas sp.]
MNEPRDDDGAASTDFSRRDFVALSVATGLAATTLPARAALAVTETDVSIKTADGSCDAAFLHPATGTYPGVIVWPDAFGLRPTMREIGRRLAGEGYAVLVPNPFYRIGRAPQFESAANVDFQDPATRAKLGPLMGSVNAAGAVEKDAAAYVAFLDAQAPVDRGRRIGSQGYCMGGALVVRTAAAVAERIGAGASFHGGGLVTDKPDSPHLLAPRIRARMYFGIAANDDQRQPDAKDKLRAAFAAAKVPAEIEVYPARHGWCIADMPSEAGAPIYSAPDAERAWAKLLALYRAALA